MIHFNVAVKYFGDEDIPAPFLLGSIAPDSIHMRKGTNREDKKRTHLDIENCTLNFASIHEVYRRHLIQNDAEEWKWFVKGYFAHLLTDYYWFNSVYTQFKENVTKDGIPAEEVRKAYYRDTDQIDFTIYRTKPWASNVWDKLIDTSLFAFEPYLTADEINFWRLRTIHWFDLLSEEPCITPAYITEAISEEFVNDAACKVKTVIEDWDSKLMEQMV
jgi:hypothetical protein